MNLSRDGEPAVTPMSGDFIHRLVIIGGGTAAVIGCIAMLGWMLALPRLTSMGQELIPMAPSTSVMFIAYGTALLLVRRSTNDLRTMPVLRSVFCIGALISVALFFLSINGIFLTLEHLGFSVMGAVEGSPVGHMSPITAFTFLLISLACLTAITARQSGDWRGVTAWWLAIVVIAAYAMLLLAYLFGTPMFYGGTFIPPAATTSLAFLALGFALLALAQPLAWPGTGRGGQDAMRYPSKVLLIVFLLLAAGIISAGYIITVSRRSTICPRLNASCPPLPTLRWANLCSGARNVWRTPASSTITSPLQIW